MALRDENVRSVTPVSKCEMLIQQLEDFRLAKQKLTSTEIPSCRTGKYNHTKVDSTSVRVAEDGLSLTAGGHDLTKCWHKFVRKNSNSDEIKSSSPCFCQRIGQCSPFDGIKQHGIYTWTKEWPDTPGSACEPSELRCRAPRVATPVVSGGCQNPKAMSSRAQGSVDASSFDVSEAESEVRKSIIQRTLFTPINSKQLHNQGGKSEDSVPWSPALSPSSQTEVLESMYILPEDETDTSLFPPVCSCHRPPKLILCKSCGKTLTGRVRKRCQVHPKQMYLMDLLCCTQCESRDLKEV